MVVIIEFLLSLKFNNIKLICPSPLDANDMVV